jgi:predicted Zn-dependent protease
MIRIILILLLWSGQALAERPMQIIGDAEIENKLRAFMSPLVKAANLNPDNIEIKIIVDPSYNAFVTNGSKMFINSGLIIKFANDPNILYGVMAHEIAHIYSGHLVRMRGEMNDMAKISIGGALLGLATALAGRPDAGMAIGAGSMGVAESGMYQYSREHEVEADKIAVDLLYKTHNNGQGLIKFFQYMNQDNDYSDVNPYMMTHPLNNERIASIRTAIKNKLGKFGDNITPEIRFNFKRIANKLEAFLGSPKAVLEKYKGNKYASSIGYFRSGQLNKAIKLLDQVIEKHQDDPYLWELKGQYYFENGKLDKAVKNYHKSLMYLPNDKIIKIELATAQINLAKDATDIELLKPAIATLHQVTAINSDNLMAYYMLSRAYGKLGNKSKAILALAEFYYYQNSYRRSYTLAKKAQKMLPKTSRDYQRANEIIELTKDKRGE